MIYSSLHAKSSPYNYPVPIQKALDWIRDNDVAAMDAGTYEISGRDMYAMIQDITTQPAKERRAERHDLYLDIQYIVSGTERMGYVPYTGNETVTEDPEGKDVMFYDGFAHEDFVDVGPGAFCIFFSNDIHRPGCAAGEKGSAVRKVVLKIREELL